MHLFICSVTEIPTSHRQRQELIERGKKWLRADTNVINIKFDQLTAPPNMHTGDAVNCASCQAVLSHISVVKEEAGSQVSHQHTNDTF